MTDSFGVHVACGSEARLGNPFQPVYEQPATVHVEHKRVADFAGCSGKTRHRTRCASVRWRILPVGAAESATRRRTSPIVAGFPATSLVPGHQVGRNVSLQRSGNGRCPVGPRFRRDYGLLNRLRMRLRTRLRSVPVPERPGGLSGREWGWGRRCSARWRPRWRRA